MNNSIEKHRIPITRMTVAVMGLAIILCGCNPDVSILTDAASETQPFVSNLVLYDSSPTDVILYEDEPIKELCTGDTGNQGTPEVSYSGRNYKAFENVEDRIVEFYHQIWGTVFFVPQVGEAGLQPLRFYLTDGEQILYEFPNCNTFVGCFSGWPEMLTIDVNDVDGDGLTDIIIVAYLCLGIGKSGAIDQSYVTVFFQRNSEFVSYDRLDNELTYNAATYTTVKEYDDLPDSEEHIHRSTTISDVLLYLSDNIFTLDEYFVSGYS